MKKGLKIITQPSLIIFIFLFVFISTIFSQVNEDKDWSEIEKLYSSGWTDKEQNIVGWEKKFQKAAQKLFIYRSKHKKNKKDISYLKTTALIAYLKELGDLDSEAMSFYKESLKHPEINSSEAVINNWQILRFAKERIQEINERTGKLKNIPVKKYPRVSIKGGSKGDPKNLPLQMKTFTLN